MAKNNKPEKSILMGTFSLGLDTKNRIAIPAKWKNFLIHEIIVKKGYDGCLEIRTPEAFEEFSTDIIASSLSHKENRIIKRLALGGATSIHIDSWNRFVVPAHLIKEASINKEVYLIGLGNVIELWSAEIYDAWKNNTDDNLDQINLKVNETSNS